MDPRVDSLTHLVESLIQAHNRLIADIEARQRHLREELVQAFESRDMIMEELRKNQQLLTDFISELGIHHVETLVLSRHAHVRDFAKRFLENDGSEQTEAEEKDTKRGA